MYEINSIGALISEELIKNKIDKRYIKEVEKGKFTSKISYFE